MAKSYGYYYNQTAKAINPYYVPIQNQISAHYGDMQQQQGGALRGNFNNRGILDSGFFGDKYADMTRDIGSQKAGALASLGTQRLQAIGDQAGTLYNASKKGTSVAAQIHTRRELLKQQLAELSAMYS